MRNIISKIFKKEDEVNKDGLILKAQLSIKDAMFDKNLVSLALEQDRLHDLNNYLLLTTKEIGEDKRSIDEEIALINEYLAAYKILKPDSFYFTIKSNVLGSSEYSIYPFVLIPLIQNAISYGCTSLEKYPIRININHIGDSLKVEVSNRVNHHIQNQEDTLLIDNFKARMELLYPNKHSLLINSNSATFKATLLLN